MTRSVSFVILKAPMKSPNPSSLFLTQKSHPRLSFLCLVFLFSFLFAKKIAVAKMTDSSETKELKVQIFGDPRPDSLPQYQIQNFKSFNPLQPENLSIATPGLTIAKLGPAGQKTSLRYNSFTTGDLTFLYDGFEISDISDPAEGFDVSSFLMVPEFNFSLTSSGTPGIFSRQTGGVLTIDSLFDSKSYWHSGIGSQGQTSMVVQKNKCSVFQCLSFGVGGSYTDGLSASLKQRVEGQSLENDTAGLGFLSLGWQREIAGRHLLKVRAYSQWTRTDIDDYDTNFIFKDDPNAKLVNQNHFLGVSYLTEHHQLFFENILSDRELTNPYDSHNENDRHESYKTFKSKLRGAHNFKNKKDGPFNNLDVFWFSQKADVHTVQENANSPREEKHMNLWEAGLQLNKNYSLGNRLKGISGANVNALEGLGVGKGVSQSFESVLVARDHQRSVLNIHLGLRERRPSFFQLFDPQFGNSKLGFEEQFYFRPKVYWVLSGKDESKHNISLEYFYEDIESRVVFLWDESKGESLYQNTGRLNSKSFILDYSYKTPRFLGRMFFRRSLDSSQVLASLPWLSQEDIGLGAEYYFQMIGRPLAVSMDIKWLSGMYNPSGKQVGNLVQSQASLSYQFDMNDRVSLQLNNIFNDKKIWDEGFQRQPFSWMLSLTKTI